MERQEYGQEKIRRIGERQTPVSQKEERNGGENQQVLDKPVATIDRPDCRDDPDEGIGCGQEMKKAAVPKPA
jgi:hypothetical protein